MKSKVLAFILIAASVLCMAPLASAQTFDYKTRQAVASDFNQWVAYSSTTVAAGAATITIEDPRMTILGRDGQINPFVANSTITVDTGSVQETVTITAVSCSDPTACTATATFGSAHSGRYAIKSGSNGLQEALDYLARLGGQGSVVVQPFFAGTTANITGAVRGSTSLSIEDWRSGVVAYYGWTGSAYAAVQSINATNTTFGATLNANGSASGANTPIQVKGIPQYVFMAANVATAGAGVTPLTGLSWTIPATTAMNYPFHCELTFNQATAATANAFSITTATQAPTNGTLWGSSTITGTYTGAIRTVTKAYAATTATTIVSVTPTATGTDEIVFLDGFIEQPSNAGTAAVSIGLATTSGGTDITTVARDSWCRLF